MFDQLLSESMTYATQADVRELRSLYYGRLDIFVSFSDDSDIDTQPKSLPSGIVAHKVEDVVGMKVKVSELYAHVFRVKKARGRYIESIKAYSLDNLYEDIKRLKQLPYMYDDDIQEVSGRVLSNPYLRSNFSRLWEMTRALSDGLSDLWAQILKDIGYIGFGDPDGLGVFAKKGTVCAFIVDQDRIEKFDIVKVQTRSEVRARIRDDVERAVKKLKTARKRVQKKNKSDAKKSVGIGELALVGHIIRSMK